MISAEQAVVAAVVWDSSVFRFAAKECAPLDFEDGRLGDMFAGVGRSIAAREPVDMVTIGDAMARWDIRGISEADLHGWISDLPSTANVDFYAAKVREGAMRRGLRSVAQGLLGASATDEPSVVAARATEALQALREGFLSDEWDAVPLGSVLQGRDDYDWVIEGLLERGDRLLLTGVEGGGKSTLVRQIAVCAAAGLHPFTFRHMDPVRVLVIDAENSELQWRRNARPLVRMAQQRGQVDPGQVLRLACARRMDLTKDKDLSQVHRLLDQYQPDLLCIGPLYRLVPRAINSDDEAAPLLAALDTLRERGCALLIEAHAGHALGAGSERDLRPRGSAALLGWPEFGMGLAVDKNGRDSRSDFKLVRWRGDRDQRGWPTFLSRSASEWPWTPTAAWQAQQSA